MKELDLGKKFIEFEKKNNLFDLKDSRGVYIWDIIRFDLYAKLKWAYKIQPPVKRNYQDVFTWFSNRLIGVLSWVRLIFDKKKYENFFYLCSRNVRDGKLFDQNAFSVINSLNENFLFETFGSNKGPMLFDRAFHDFPKFLHRKFHKNKSEFDFEIIINKVIQEFKQCPMDALALKALVDNYYSDLDFFKKLFAQKGVKRIFVNQNGIQKALFSAASDLKIPSYEFQHGIVGSDHLAYNYPVMAYRKEQIYLPNAIFSLSRYWFKDLNCPFVNVYPLGNNFFSEKIIENSLDDNALTVISANVFGLELQKFLLRYINQPFLKEKKIFFKLHPNQFHDKEYYESGFKLYKNIKVITNEYSVAGLLANSKMLLTIESTVVYEALQAGKKVLLLKEDNDITRHKDLASNSNVYWISDKESLSSALNSNIIISPVEFFSPFNEQVLYKALVECGADIV